MLSFTREYVLTHIIYSLHLLNMRTHTVYIYITRHRCVDRPSQRNQDEHFGDSSKSIQTLWKDDGRYSRAPSSEKVRCPRPLLTVLRQKELSDSNMPTIGTIVRGVATFS